MMPRVRDREPDWDAIIVPERYPQKALPRARAWRRCEFWRAYDLQMGEGLTRQMPELRELAGSEHEAAEDGKLTTSIQPHEAPRAEHRPYHEAVRLGERAKASGDRAKDVAYG